MRKIALALAFSFAFSLEMPDLALALDFYKMLDLQVGKERITGRVMTHDDLSCWFLHRDGRLQKIPMTQVTDFSEVGDKFKPYSQIELKSQLQAEFGKSFEVRTTSHYVVVGRRGAAEAYAAIFEQIYRDFVRSFRTRGFQVNEPEFPLVAIVFPDQTAFVKYCRAERTPVRPGLVGYYLPSSNRVAMFERPNALDVDGTVIHEATHQVAFNTGVHSRLARHPKWVVEGLATVFEADGIRSRQDLTTPADRINRERDLWFQDYAKFRRPAHSMAALVREDQLFEKSPMDAYSEAWALSFFLIETRPADYAGYLKRLVNRDPLSAYDAESRLKDFVDAFGADADALETSFLRYIKKISER